MKQGICGNGKMKIRGPRSAECGLYGYSFFSEHGRMPYGELPHGDAGVREHLASMFGARASQRPEEFLRLAGMKKRQANKEPCPCGSGRRLGLCHSRNVNRLRSQLGRQWFQAEHKQIVRNHGC